MDRLEFREFKNVPRFKEHLYWIPIDRLQMSITQLFVSRLRLNEYGKLVLKMGTGTGKTLTSLIVANSYLNVIKTININENLLRGDKHHVNIIGFTEKGFKKELLKYPELGFITYNERKELDKLDEQIIRTEGDSREILVNKRKTLTTNIKKRFSDMNDRGFIKFYGYKKLFNDLFFQGIPQDKKVHEIIEDVMNNKIKVNLEVLGEFRYSLIIADEIHITYNSSEINNYGLALQLILEYSKNEIFLIMLSATIINNNKRELIDFTNLIRDHNVPLFRSEDFFYTDSNELKQPLTPLYEQIKNKVIFLEENTKDYPEVIYPFSSPLKDSATEAIRQAYDPKKEFINFTECQLTPLHEATYRHHGLFDDNASIRTEIANDLVVPNPDYPAEEILKWNPDHPEFKNRDKNIIGLIDPTEIKEKLLNAPLEWKRKIGIEIHLEKEYYTLTGDWLRYENLKIYYSKGKRIVEIIHERLKKNPRTKILIYHHNVKGSGILLISEMLLRNGFIEYGYTPKNDTLNSLKYETYADAIKNKNSNYTPATIMTLDYEAKGSRQDDMIKLFNNKETNTYGDIVKVFLGSQKIKQSVDFIGVTMQINVSSPTNIPEYIQIKGRTVRNGSLDALPRADRKVYMHTIIGVSKSGHTLEVKKYIRKVKEFKVIQEIEYNINKDGINNYIYGYKKFHNDDPLGALDFKVDLPTEEIKEDTYFQYYRYVYDFMFNLIKRAFVSNPIWKKDELWNFIKTNPAINIKIDRDIYYQIYNYVLYKLIYYDTKRSINIETDIFNTYNIYVDKYRVQGKTYSSIKKAIIYIDGYLILLPIDVEGNIELLPQSYLRKHKESTVLKYRLKFDTKFTFDKNFNKFMKQYNESNSKETLKYLFLLEFKREEHHELLKQHIMGVRKIPDEIFELYKGLELADDDLYIESEIIHKYEDNKWEIYNNIDEPKKENSIVGIMSYKSLKIKMSADTNTDSRKNLKGVKCDTIKKQTLIETYQILSGKPVDIKNVGNLCNAIFIKLVNLEINSILNDENIKYLYSYN